MSLYFIHFNLYSDPSKHITKFNHTEMKNFLVKHRFFVLIAALALLLVFQIKVVTPYVLKIASSDLFLEDSGDEKSYVSETTTMTNSAFEECNLYIKNELYPDLSFNFPAEPLNAFKMGNYQYVINSDVEIFPEDGPSLSRKYVCRIKYLNEDDMSGVSDPENWSVVGVSGLKDL